MFESTLQFILFSLASFRLTRLLVYDKITAFIRKPFFQEEVLENEEGKKEVYIVPVKKGLRSWIGELLSCHWCTGIWMAISLVLLDSFLPKAAEPIIAVLAIAGLASILETIVQLFIEE